jgi:serralysin
MSEQPRSWICSTIDVPGGANTASAAAVEAAAASGLEGIAEKGKLWDRSTVLRVRFLAGEPALHAKVLEAARAWLQPGVQLDILAAKPGERAQIRVAFDEADGAWSAVGIDSLTYRPSKPTMNLGWANLKTPKRDFDSVVIHEFGHALGLLHEHNHPLAKIRWNKPAVNADLSGEPNFWDQETIDSNVFEAYKKSDVIVTDFDAASIMIYTIPASWTLDGRAFMPSWKLSAGDKATIRKLYA